MLTAQKERAQGENHGDFTLKLRVKQNDFQGVIFKTRGKKALVSWEFDAVAFTFKPADDNVTSAGLSRKMHQ